MHWIKSHMTLVIVSAVSVLSVTGMVLGFFLADVTTDIERDAVLINRLGGVQGINQAVIDQARQQQAETGRQLSEFLDRFGSSASVREPLQADVFSGRDSGERDAAKAEFQTRYAQKQRALLTKLKAHGPPTATDFQDYETLLRRRTEKLENPADRPVDVTPGGPRPSWSRLTRSDWKSRSAAGSRTLGTSSDELTAKARAELPTRWARDMHGIYCYADQSSLDQRPEITETKGFPSIDDMWYAQVALWVQEDVIGALADLNEQTAATLPKEQQWVAYLPVKNLVKFTVGHYVGPPTTGGTTEGRQPQPSGGTSGEDLLRGDVGSAFTGRGSDQDVDVIRFSVELVVDARKTRTVMYAISRAGFYTPLSVSYQAESVYNESSARREVNGYAYGSAPTIRLNLVYEACFLRSSYENWIPASVVAAVGKGEAGGMSGSVRTSGAGTGDRSSHRPGQRTGRWGDRRPGSRGGVEEAAE